MGKVILLIFIIFILFAIYSGIRNIIQGLGGGIDKRVRPLDNKLIMELERLSNLYERGLLSVEEFKEIKQKLIGK